MASLVVTNTFVAGTTILSAAMNTNFDDIETYINNRNSGAAAWERVLATNASSVPAVFNNGAGTNDSLNAQDNGTNVFRVADAGNVVIGNAALATTATDGFLYIESCAGTPTGVPTTFTGRVPIIFDSTNNLLYIYDGSWLTSQAQVDNSTIEISGGSLRVKDLGITSAKLASSIAAATLDVTTALSWKTFNQLKILQIQQFTNTTSSSTTSGTFGDTNTLVTITPKISTSQIVIFVHFSVSVGAGSTASFTIARGGSNLLAAGDGFWRAAANFSGYGSFCYVDSPGSTSAQTYSLQFKSGAGGVTLQNVNETASIIAVEVAA